MFQGTLVKNHWSKWRLFYSARRVAALSCNLLFAIRGAVHNEKIQSALPFLFNIRFNIEEILRMTTKAKFGALAHYCYKYWWVKHAYILLINSLKSYIGHSRWARIFCLTCFTLFNKHYLSFIKRATSFFNPFCTIDL